MIARCLGEARHIRPGSLEPGGLSLVASPWSLGAPGEARIRPGSRASSEPGRCAPLASAGCVWPWCSYMGCLRRTRHESDVPLPLTVPCVYGRPLLFDGRALKNVWTLSRTALAGLQC